MGDYLFGVGTTHKVISNNKIVEMLIIGCCVKDDTGAIHDYAGVPGGTGFKGQVYYFEHRELLGRDWNW